MAKRRRRRRGRRFHWIAASHAARLAHLLEAGRLKELALYDRVLRDEYRAVRGGAAPLPTTHPVFTAPFLAPPTRLARLHRGTRTG